MKKFFTFLSILIISLTVYVSFNDLIPSSEKPLDKYDFSIENALDHCFCFHLGILIIFNG